MIKKIQVRNLSAGYGNGEVIRDASFDILPGTMTGIIGPNGAGKTTLLKALLRQVPTTGKVTWGDDTRLDLREIAYVAQSNKIDVSFPMTAGEVALQGTYADMRWWARPGRREREWARQCLKKVGMETWNETPINELSGGQLARVLLARALAQRPQAFFLDEPLAAVDATSQNRIIEVLRRQRDAGQAVVVVHHNVQEAARYFDRLIAVNSTVIAQGQVEEVLNSEVLSQVYPDWGLFQPSIPSPRVKG